MLFLNPWKQGDIFHPGLLSESQRFLDSIGYGIDLNTFVADTTLAVFSNYVMAKKTYWEKWRSIAEKFLDYLEKGNLPDVVVGNYGGSARERYPMKIFIQERFLTIILARNKMRVFVPDVSLKVPIWQSLFENSSSNRHLLIV